MLIILPILTGLAFFSGGLWAVAGIVGGISNYGWACWQHRRAVSVPRWVLLGLLLLVVMIVLANLQAINPPLSWSKGWQLLALLLALAGFSIKAGDGKSMPDFRFWTIMFIGFSLLLGLELALGGPLLPLLKGPDATLVKYNRGLSYAAMFVWVLVAWGMLKRRWILLGLLIAAMLIPLAQTESRATMMAMTAAVAVFGVAVLNRNLARWSLSLLVGVTAGWPFYAYAVLEHALHWVNHLPASWHARMEIWDYMAARIMEKPWLGWGLASSGQLEITSPHQPLYQMISDPAGHSHNMVTQWWVELGIPGLLAGLGFCLITLWSTRRLPQAVQPYALASWTVGLVLALCAYNFWTDSFLAAMTLTAYSFAMLQWTAQAELRDH
jgi:O-antigen ligase